MPYSPLQISTGDNRVDFIFRDVIEQYLSDAYWLFAVACPEDRRNPSFHNPIALLLFGAMAACSALPTFNKPGHVRRTDTKDFVEWSKTYFPWSKVSVFDDQFRPARELPQIAAEQLYRSFRCPLFHTAGMVHSSFPAVKLVKTHPQTRNIVENEAVLNELFQRDLCGDEFMRLEFGSVTLVLEPFYLGLRSAIEIYASDPEAIDRIKAHI